MAAYIASTRSNYFRVTNAKAFEAWCPRLSLEFWTSECKESPGELFYAITADTSDCFGWPSYDPETGADIDFTAELADHLDPRDVAILFEVGSEKLRYLCGLAAAVHPGGRTLTLSLDDIYPRARKAFGRKLTITEGRY